MKEIETMQEKYDATVKRFVVIYFYISTIYIAMIIVIWWTSATYLFRFIICILFIVQVGTLVVVRNFHILGIAKVYRIYTIIALSLLFPVALFDNNYGSIEASMWYIVAPLIISVVQQQGKKLVSWNIFAFSLLFVILVFPMILKMCGLEANMNIFIKKLYKNVDYLDFKKNEYLWYFIQYFKLISMFSIFALVCYCVHYKEKLYKLRLDDLYENISQNAENELNATIKDEELKKYEKLYTDIVKYMETNRPFTDKDFSIAQLSSALNINPAYLSSAISMKRNMHFNTFVNTYRIENVKQMLRFNAKKYTLEHIYLSSGFKSQSTFNKAFKLSEGITPTEYINSLENSEISEQ